MAKKKEIIQLSPFMNRVHFMGRLASILSILVFGGVGVAICTYFHIFPSFQKFISSWVFVFILLLVSGIMEFAVSLPILGSGATYISFITGNVSNMKLPSITAAMSAAGVKQGTEEHEVLSIISSVVGSLLVIVAITLVVAFSDFFAPVLEWEPIQPAFNYIMPAICGLMIAGPLVQNPKLVLPVLAAGTVAVLVTNNSTMVVMVVCIVVAMILYFIYGRKMKPQAPAAKVTEETKAE